MLGQLPPGIAGSPPRSTGPSSTRTVAPRHAAAAHLLIRRTRRRPSAPGDRPDARGRPARAIGQSSRAVSPGCSSRTEQGRRNRAACSANSVPGRLNRSRRTGPRPTGHIVPKCTGTAWWASSSARKPAARSASRCPDPTWGPSRRPAGGRCRIAQPPPAPGPTCRCRRRSRCGPSRSRRTRGQAPAAETRATGGRHARPEPPRRRHPPRGPCRPGRPRPVHGRAAVAARARRAVRRSGPPPERVAAGRKATRGGDGRRADATQRPDLRSGTGRRAAAPVAGAGAPAESRTAGR